MTRMKLLTCDGCEARVARVNEDRYPILPVGVTCPACAHPAWTPLRPAAGC